MLHGHKSHTPDPVVLTVAMCGTHHEVPRCAVSFSSFYCLFTSANINTLVVLNTHCKGNIPKQKYVFFVLWFLKPRNLVAASAPYWKAWKEISITKFKEPAITVPGAKRHEDDGCVVFCRVVLCPVVSCCVVSRRVVFYYILSCRVMLCRASERYSSLFTRPAQTSPLVSNMNLLVLDRPKQGSFRPSGWVLCYLILLHFTLFLSLAGSSVGTVTRLRTGP